MREAEPSPTADRAIEAIRDGLAVHFADPDRERVRKLRRRIARRIEADIALLDALDGDADLEDDSDGEPSLGSLGGTADSRGVEQSRWSGGGDGDREAGDDHGIADAGGLAEQRRRHRRLVAGGLIMSRPADRRGFFRGLVSLPLIGGGVTLIGAPSAVAEPVTDGLLDAYDTFLFYERCRLNAERFGEARRWQGTDYPDDRLRQALGYVRLDNGATQFHSAEDFGPVGPSARAALVLATIGCGWREGSA